MSHRGSADRVRAIVNEGSTESPWSVRLRRWGLLGWWLIGVVVAVYLAYLALASVRIVVLPVLLALFPGAILLQPARALQRRGVPRALSALIVVVSFFALIFGIGYLVWRPLVEGLSEVGGQLEVAYEAFRLWLVESPLRLTEQQIDQWIDTAWGFANRNGGAFLLGGAATVLEVLIGLGTLIVVLFFILKDADRMADLALERVKGGSDQRLRTGLSVGRTTIAHYLGGLAIVGLFDAVFIGLGLHLIGVPLAFPIAVIAFFASFFPLIGAWVAGLIGVAVAFINGGITDALLALAVITLVEQLEANVIAPIVFRQTLQLHPFLTIIGILAGGALFGILGAFLAVPMLAVFFAIKQAIDPDPDRSFVVLARAR